MIRQNLVIWLAMKMREPRSSFSETETWRDELPELLAILDPRERTIIFQRFGLDGARPRTLEEVGKKLGVTRERIRQVQNIALMKLRRALSRKETPAIEF
jgi:RNA polymerase primary sigma factor